MEDILSKQSANVYFAATVQLKPVPTEILTMAIMLIHAFVASKINNHNFCFLKWFGAASSVLPPTDSR